MAVPVAARPGTGAPAWEAAALSWRELPQSELAAVVIIASAWFVVRCFIEISKCLDCSP